MKRDLKRIYRQHGIKYFAFPVIVLLLLIAVLDQRLGGYLDHREETADLQARLENNRAILDLNSKIAQNSEQLEPTFAPLSAQMFVAPEITQSVSAMQDQVRQMLTALYFDNIELTDFSDSNKGSVSQLAMTARFNGVPQQIPRLQTSLLQSPTLLAMDNLEIRVIDDPQRGGQQLAFAARFSGLSMQPLPPLNSASAPKKSETKP